MNLFGFSAIVAYLARWLVPPTFARGNPLRVRHHLRQWERGRKSRLRYLELLEHQGLPRPFWGPILGISAGLALVRASSQGTYGKMVVIGY
jgi:hypothetical protein